MASSQNATATRIAPPTRGSTPKIEKKLGEDTRKLNEETEKMKKSAQDKIGAIEKKRDEDARKAGEDLEKLKTKAKEKIEQLKAENHPDWQAMLAGEWPEGAAMDPLAFHHLVVQTIEGIIARHKGQAVVVVCHGGVINSYLAHVLGLAPSTGFFYPNYTSIHRVAAAGTGERSLVTMNETAHLRGTGLPIGLFTT